MTELCEEIRMMLLKVCITMFLEIAKGNDLSNDEFLKYAYTPLKKLYDNMDEEGRKLIYTDDMFLRQILAYEHFYIKVLSGMWKYDE
jgi:hypothetical protein